MAGTIEQTSIQPIRQPAKKSPPSSAPTRPAASPVPSASTSSLHSQDGNFALPPPQQRASIPSSAPTPNGDSLTRPIPQKKPTMTARISGMFRSREPDSSRDASTEALVEKAAENFTRNGTPSLNGTKAVPARQGSYSEAKKNSIERTKSASIKKKDDAPTAVSSRFWMTEDGNHEHHLKVQKRNEKLTNIFQDLMGRKRKDGEDPPLSLMASWVDQIRNEKDKMAADQKGGPNATMSLVQKYGKCQEVVGRGAFGIVRVAHKTDAKDPRREQLFAVKEFRQRPGESDKKYQKRLTSEFCISSSMQHPNVIHTLDLLKDDKGDFCEVMEYCAGGDLYTLILTAGTLEVLEADCFFKQLMRGVEYMHEMGVAHRDLKPENLLLTSHGSIKITDFGNGECFRMAWEKEAHMTAGLCGSAPYIAPEEYIDQEFDPRAVDVWACGIIYMAMRSGRHLWRVARKGEDEFFTRYLEDRREESGYHPIEVLKRRQCRNVVYSILDPNPNRRLTAHQVLLSEWVKEIQVCRAGNEGF